MPAKVSFKGNPLTLAGRNIKINMPAPDFKVTAQDLSEVRLSDFKGKIKLVTFFPSLDTPVCDLQVKTFNKKASEVSEDVVIIGISKDLPFAQKRFCEAYEITHARVVSDYKTSSFGINYGVLIKELNLLARGVVIIDKSDVVRYMRLADELTHAPDYNEALTSLDEVVKTQDGSYPDSLLSKCLPCETATLPLPKERIEKLLAQYRGWELVEGKKLVKEFKFKDFLEAKFFLDLICLIAHEQEHHPTLTLIYNKLRVTLTTHSSGGLTDNDFIMAKIIDELG